MFRLQKCILFRLLSSASASASTPSIFSIRRPLSAAASATPKPFAVDEYLVTICGLTRAQALEASKKLSHLKSPSRLDAVVSFLSGLGLSRSDIAAVVAVDPQFLCSIVEKNLRKRVVELTDLGLSRSKIASLISLCPTTFRTSSSATNLAFWLPVFGSFEKILKALKMSACLLTVDLEKVAKPNLALLQQFGIHVCDFPDASMVICRPPKQVQDAVVHVSKFGVPPDSRMFRHALRTFAFQSQEKIANKIRILEMFGWSYNDLLISVRKMPCILNMSEERLRRNVNFLTRDARLEVSYIVQRPTLIMYSLERRLLPRYRVLKFLHEKGLLKGEFDLYAAVVVTDEKFLERFVRPYKESIVPPELLAELGRSQMDLQFDRTKEN